MLKTHFLYLLYWVVVAFIPLNLTKLYLSHCWSSYPTLKLKCLVFLNLTLGAYRWVGLRQGLCAPVSALRPHRREMPCVCLRMSSSTFADSTWCYLGYEDHAWGRIIDASVIISTDAFWSFITLGSHCLYQKLVRK